MLERLTPRIAAAMVAGLITTACGTGGPTTAERPDDDALEPELIAQTPTPTPVPTPATTDYTIVEGDTLSGLASRFDVTVDELLEVNGMTLDSVLNIGGTMRIPIPVRSDTTEDGEDPAVDDSRILTTYTVADGDTLGSIADRFDTTVDELLEINDQLATDSVLHVGDTLEVPVPSASSPDSAAEGPVPAPGTNRLDIDEYVVVPGDTLGSIALRSGVTVGDLLDANNLTTDSVLHVGQVLTIPDV